MRWKKNEHCDGYKRIITRFLLFPKCLNGEYRWLEFAKIEQQLSVFCDPNLDVYRIYHDVAWANKEQLI